jgi:hypothetical protein
LPRATININIDIQVGSATSPLLLLKQPPPYQLSTTRISPERLGSTQTHRRI